MTYRLQMCYANFSTSLLPVSNGGRGYQEQFYAEMVSLLFQKLSLLLQKLSLLLPMLNLPMPWVSEPLLNRPC